MHIVIAADSFKGSYSSIEVGEALKRGVQRVFPSASFKIVPIADGGEGTVTTILEAVGGELQKLPVLDPLGREIESFWGKLANGNAVLEMAAASGLPLLHDSERNPTKATTYGTGTLIKAALDHGCRQIMIGIGGSATNDGGVGMARALGVRFLRADGSELNGEPRQLAELAHIDFSGLDVRLKDTELLVACDVSNPLLGQDGATAIYGPQKGANPQMLKLLEGNLAHLAKIVTQVTGKDFAKEPGAGAAGGLGYGLLSFCGGCLMPGVETLLRVIEFDQIIAKADLVLTGEGRLDGQSVYGKAPIGVASWAKGAGKPVIAIAGQLGAAAERVYEHGIDSLFATVDRIQSLEEALSNGAVSLERTAERMARTLQVGIGLADRS